MAEGRTEPSGRQTTSGRGKVGDVEYNLLATMTNLLQGQEALGRYVADAEQAGDDEAAQALRAIFQGNERGINLLRPILARLVGGTS